MDTYTLVIWEVSPEGIELYLIPNDVIQPEDHELLKQAQGGYMGSVAPNVWAATELYEWLQDKLDYVQDNDTPIESPITHVYSSGEIL